ncbi:hypothetical protein HYQ45_011637 [Verticillium longisporum]|uniref:Uncharacterized protein n=1 Tax=Verticillium longisporum TaxID=100787 RepID=A0A8I2ZE13_VERLO|nr:hypothetical protein HYQ45_011637 [Verticillium longisporum]
MLSLSNCQVACAPAASISYPFFGLAQLPNRLPGCTQSWLVEKASMGSMDPTTYPVPHFAVRNIATTPVNQAHAWSAALGRRVAN